jgi:hypothetical protein
MADTQGSIADDGLRVCVCVVDGGFFMVDRQNPGMAFV